MRVPCISLAGALTIVAALAVPGVGAQTSLAITSVVASADRTALLVHGRNMCAAPTVTLGELPQTVTSADAALVTIAYPDVASGSYRLTVSCGTQPGRTGYMDVDLRGRQRSGGGRP